MDLKAQENASFGQRGFNWYNTAMHIAIVGCMGIGKSVLTDALSKHLDYRAFFEPVKENPYLDDFYADPQRHAAMMQIYMMTSRFRQHMEIQQLNRDNIGVVQDLTIYCDVLYGQLTHEFGFMSDRDYTTYKEHFEAIRAMLLLPDVVVHLMADVDQVAARIAKRGRASEKGIDVNYLRRLSELIEGWSNSVEKKTNVIHLDWNAFQPVNDVVDKIERELSLQLRIPVVATA